MTRRGKDNRWDDIDGGYAFVIPNTLLQHPNFVRLSPYGNKLVMDMARQFTGYNNGYLCASWSLMQDAGWNSSETLWRSVLECEHYRIIFRTMQGGRNKPNLHSLTWRRIDNMKNSKHTLDVPPTIKPSDLWKEERPDFDLTILHRPRRKQRVLKKVA